MKTDLSQVKEVIKAMIGIELNDNQLEELNKIVIASNKSKLFQIEMGLCQSQKANCVDQLHHALDKYHHPGMKVEQIKTIVKNVLINKAPTPDITETVRLLIAD